VRREILCLSASTLRGSDCYQQGSVFITGTGSVQRIGKNTITNVRLQGRGWTDDLCNDPHPVIDHCWIGKKADSVPQNYSQRKDELTNKQYSKIASELFFRGVMDVLQDGPIEKNRLGKRLGIRYNVLDNLLDVMEQDKHIFSIDDHFALDTGRNQ
jgi:hypothetical protein